MNCMINLSKPVKKIKVNFRDHSEETEVIPIVPYQLTPEGYGNRLDEFHTNRWITMRCPTGVEYGIQNYTKKKGYVRCVYNWIDIGKVEVPKTNTMDESIKAGVDFCQNHWNNLFYKILRGELCIL